MAEKVFGLTRRSVERTASVVKRELSALPRVPRLTQRTYDGSTGGCDTQNTIWDISILGAPTGGTFSLSVTVNGVTSSITFNWNDSASTFASTLATGHSEIASADLNATDGPFPNVTVRVEFKATLANTLILPPTANYGSLTGGSGRGIICALAQRGHGA